MVGSLIFITGATGFIGSQVVQDTLNAGHRARLSVRREAQIEQVKSRYPSHASQLEFVVIPDISNVDALRSALGDDVEYIFHIASPMPGKGTDFKTEYLGPAVKGTEAILDAAAAAPNVKRVVIVSSLLALMPLNGLQVPGLVIKEGTNPSITIDPDMAFPEGPGGNGPKYSASKILAHRATLAWMETHKPQFTLITLHPTFVLGHDLTQTTPTPGGINAWVLHSLASGKPLIPASFVDVRDVSLAHLRSLDTPVDVAAPLTEELLAGPETSWREIAALVKGRYPGVVTTLDPEGEYNVPFKADSARTERDLGITWRGIEEIVSSVLEQQLQLRARAGL
ncbi:hypothetical protein B0T22DRAFT_521308 [Podospora appendiculata]|uniref:NAD-dependent epimerase/dehydratase domain-containing protein n=1 Tax=Podospora appendiculata TaxID=314037 RepID=A0AAE1C7V7_9PEZI|nr:hypothetical protein B0T22DRAFT_521308 [Podospora appendiculata]